MKNEILRIENLNVIKHGIKTLDNFFMNLYKGELLGVFANNTTDKENFIDLICGKFKFDKGRVCYGSKPMDFAGYQIIRNNKIALIKPISKLVEDLTVATNMFVIRDSFKHQIINDSVITEQANLLMSELGICIDADWYVHQLSKYEKSVIEIVKAYGRKSDIVILQDLSRYLTDLEISQIHQLIKKLKSTGMSVIIVDSYTNVFEKFSDRVIVLKNGRNIWTFDASELNEDTLKKVYSQSKYKKPVMNPANSQGVQKTALTFRNVSIRQLNQLDITLKSGEILSIFDREGTGVDDIRRILMGEIKDYKGEVKIGEQPLKTRKPWQSVKQKIGFVAENPSETMIFDNLSAIENLCYPAIDKTSNIWLRSRFLKSVLKDYAPYFSEDALYELAGDLSAHDTHRLVYFKWHLFNPKVVVCTKPFTSVDLALKNETLLLMERLLKKGIAVLILTSNYEDVNTHGRIMDISSEECPLLPKECPLMTLKTDANI